MRIIACFKAAPDDSDITVGADRTLDVSRAQPKIGSYDLNAIEAARQLADQVGGEVIGISLGGAALANSKLRKDALSRGLDSLVAVAGDPDADSFQTATALAAAIGELGGCDLVLLENAEQVLGVTLPAVLSVTSGINTPRIAGMKDILAAGKKPVTETASALPPASSRTSSVLAPEQVDRRHVLVEADPEDAARQLAQFLKTL